MILSYMICMLFVRKLLVQKQTKVISINFDTEQILSKNVKHVMDSVHDKIFILQTGFWLLDVNLPL
jgi:hypothetical protein